VLLAVAACTTIAPYSHTAYEQATSVKAQALLVMDAATEPFADHRAEVRELRLSVEKAYEYAKGRPNNEYSTKQWEIVRDPARSSLAGFLRRWEEKGVLKDAFISEAKKIVAEQLDEISALESGKIRPKEQG
jgi:hypothetical protein